MWGLSIKKFSKYFALFYRISPRSVANSILRFRAAVVLLGWEVCLVVGDINKKMKILPEYYQFDSFGLRQCKDNSERYTIRV